MKSLFRYFDPLRILERERKKYLHDVSLPKYISSLVEAKLPEFTQNCSDLEYLVLDFETTGLDPKKDRILSIGTVEIKQMKLNLQSAQTTFICDVTAVKPETAVINHIVPEMISNGVPLEQAMESLFKQMEGKILLAHGMFVEQRFIHYFLEQSLGLSPLPVPWLDTLRLEKTMLKSKWHQENDFTLSGIRSQYGLPDYPAHEALVDAVATGELYLAQLKRIFGFKTGSFETIYRRVYA